MPASPQDRAGTGLVGRAVRRNLLLVLVTTLLCGAVAAALSVTRAPTYTASARVLVSPLQENALSPDLMGSSQQIAIGMNTEAQLINSSGVVKLANELLGKKMTPANAPVSASVPPNSQIVKVQYKAPNAAVAKQGADAYAKAFLKFRSARAETNRTLQLDALLSEIDAVQAKLTQASAAGDKQQARAYASDLAKLRANLSHSPSGAATPGLLISPVETPTKPPGFSRWILVLAGLLLGLGVGLALAVWRERHDDRIRGGAVSSVEGLPVLATLRMRPRRGDRAGADGVVAGSLGEGFRQLRAGVIAFAPAPGAITVAGVQDDGGTDYLAVNLADTLASSGYRVTLVSTSSHSSVEEMLGVSSSPGLSELLDNSVALEQSTVVVDGVTLLPRGGSTELSSDLLAGKRFIAVIDELRRDADYVIVVTGSLSAAAGLSVARSTDCTVLTCVDGVTTHAEAEAAIGRSRQLGVSVLGIVLMERTKRGAARRSRTSSPRAGSSAPVPTTKVDASGASERQSSIATPPR